MDNPEVARHITRLRDKDAYVRRTAAEALGKIGDASAVPALTEALNDSNQFVSRSAAHALDRIGPPTLPALIAALKHNTPHVRRHAAQALGKTGNISVVPVLIQTLKDPDNLVRQYAARALGNIGDSHTLPRKILAHGRLSARERITILDSLRRVRYKNSFITLRYDFPATGNLCQAVLKENDPEARAGAQTVLNWLNGEQHLVQASQLAPMSPDHLLRPFEAAHPETRTATLLHASDRPEATPQPPPPRPAILDRLFRKRTN